MKTGTTPMPLWRRASEYGRASLLAGVAFIEITHCTVWDLPPRSFIPHQHLNRLGAGMPVVARMLPFVVHGSQVMASFVRESTFAALVANQSDSRFRIGNPIDGL